MKYETIKINIGTNFTYNKHLSKLVNINLRKILTNIKLYYIL